MSAAPNLPFDRHAEDAGNILALEHCNVRVPDQRLATVFYVEGLGLTRDPYMHTTDANMWVNVGRNQFHMPANKAAQVFRGVIGVVTPHLDLLRTRLAGVERKLVDTRFSWRDEGATILASCPWGNQIRLHAAGAFGRMVLGIPYVELPVPRGSAPGIVRFYRDVMKALARERSVAGNLVAEITVGVNQRLRFIETDAALAPYDQHHIAIYVADFSSPHGWLAERGLITEESDAWQYRFEMITDPLTGAPLFQIEHEVRSLSHPMYSRHHALVNRNPHQLQSNYATGRDAYYEPHLPL